MNDPRAVLSLRDVSYATADGRPLITGLNLTLHAAELLVVNGPNGAGKSTLLEIMLGRRRCDTGTVQRHVPAASISYLPQLQDNENHLPFSLRDVLNVATGTDDKDMLSPGLLTKQQLDLSWNRASGGEKRRTLLTRTLLQRPRLLILDEPFNHLDHHSRELMKATIGNFVAGQQQTAILTTHEPLASAALATDLNLRHISL